MSKLACFFGVHQWSKWESLGDMKMYSEYNTKLPSKVVRNYVSTCTVCGNLGKRKVSL